MGTEHPEPAAWEAETHTQKHRHTYKCARTRGRLQAAPLHTRLSSQTGPRARKPSKKVWIRIAEGAGEEGLSASLP